MVNLPDKFGDVGHETPEVGPLEDAIDAVLAMRLALFREQLPNIEMLDEFHADAAAARERINAHMGELQRIRDEVRQELLDRAEIREKREHERETDAVLRPDGQC